MARCGNYFGDMGVSIDTYQAVIRDASHIREPQDEDWRVARY